MPYRDRLRALMREPLVHFLIGGLAIFLFFAVRGVAVDPASRSVTIDRPQVERLAAQFSQTFQRAPNPDEIDDLIRDYIEEEIYYREALRIGLDADDPVIRRRLHLKMKYLARSALENERPDDAALQRMLDANPAKYAAGATHAFDQIYLGSGAGGGAQSAALLERLQSGADWRSQGERLSVPATMDAANRSAIARHFGDEFARQLVGLGRQPLDVWRGPIPSGYGTHLVRLRAVSVASSPNLAEVRQALENDWRAQTIAAREAAAYQALLDGYTVTIAEP